MRQAIIWTNVGMLCWYLYRGYPIKRALPAMQGPFGKIPSIGVTRPQWVMHAKMCWLWINIDVDLLSDCGWARFYLANERRFYVCNIFSHLLQPLLSQNTKWTWSLLRYGLHFANRFLFFFSLQSKESDFVENVPWYFKWCCIYVILSSHLNPWCPVNMGETTVSNE